MRNYEADNMRRLDDLTRISADVPATRKVYHSEHIFSYRDAAGRDYGFYVEDDSLPATMFGKRASRHATLQEVQAKEKKLYWHGKPSL